MQTKDETIEIEGPHRQITRIAAYAVLVEGDSILLCRLSAGAIPSGSWTLPGGGIEFGESPQEAVVREVQEETGLAVDVGPILGIDSLVTEDRDGAKRHSIRVVYKASVAGGQLVNEIGGSTDLAEWISFSSLDRIPKVDLVDYAIIALRRFV